jgi:hypothetical protein
MKCIVFGSDAGRRGVVKSLLFRMTSRDTQARARRPKRMAVGPRGFI